MFAAVVGFGVLCGIAVVRGVRQRHVASLWLAIAFAGIVVTASMVSQVGDPDGLLRLLAVAGGLVVTPVALVEFSHRLRPVHPSVRVALGGLALGALGGVVAVGAVDPSAFSDEGSTLAALLLQGLAGAVWITAIILVAWRLLRHAHRLTSSVGRARARTIAVGALLLAPSAGLPLITNSVDESMGVGLALLACAVIYLGYVPPGWARWTWARKDTLRVQADELQALRTPGGGVDVWLQSVMERWDGQSAWFDVAGERVTTVGDHTLPVALPEHDHVEGVTTTPLATDDWLIVACVADAHLGLRTPVDPVLFGDEQSKLLLVTAARMHVAWTRQMLEEQRRRDVVQEQAETHRVETDRLRDDVLSTLSHELRTPLVTLRGVPELLLARWDDLSGAQARDMIGRIHANALALQRVVDVTMLLAEVRSGQVRPVPARIPVSDVVAAAIERLDHTGKETSRLVAEDLGDAVVDTDVRLAAAVLAELMDNGLTYSEPPEEVRITAEGEGEHVLLHVVDRGRGLDGHDNGAFLAAFHRGGEVLTRDRRGLGVGLTLAGEVTARLGGRLDARPGDSVGMVVTLRLPRDVRVLLEDSADVTP